MDSSNYDANYINTLGGKRRYDILLSQTDQEKLKNWEKEQEKLKNNLSNEDDPMLQDILYIGGVDISFDKRDKKIGISGIVILDYKTLDIVYEDYNLVKIDEPYIPGFLAFREVKHLVKLVEDLKRNASQFLPQVILLDGNGILHSRGFGLACHLGVLTDIATIGCSKTVFSVDGITKDKVKEISKNNLSKKGDSYELIGLSGRQWGYALKSSNKEEDDPLIISMGHKITNQTALKIVKKMCKSRIAEPIRIADLITRRLINARKKFGMKNNIQNWNIRDYLNENRDYLHKNMDQCIEDEKDNEKDEIDINFGIRGRRGKGEFRGERGRGKFRGERGRGEFRGIKRFRGPFRGRGERRIYPNVQSEVEDREGREDEQIKKERNIIDEIEETVGFRLSDEERERKEILKNKDEGREEEFFRGEGKDRWQFRGRGRGRGPFRGRGRGRGPFRGRGRDRGLFRGRGRGRGPFRSRGSIGEKFED